MRNEYLSTKILKGLASFQEGQLEEHDLLEVNDD